MHLARIVTLPALAVALAAALSLGTPEEADAAGSWGLAYKPDLRILSLGPSSVSSNHARLLVTNQGKWASKACYAKIICYGPTTTYGYAWVPDMKPGEIWGIDGWVGQLISASPGSYTVGWIDCFQAVSESNEGNNITYYVAPPS